MSDTRTDSVTELEELLDAEIPCGGGHYPPRSCGDAAALRSRCHGCRTYYKCIPCWQHWYSYAVEWVAKNGAVPCHICGERFTTAEAFSDYRPF